MAHLDPERVREMFKQFKASPDFTLSEAGFMKILSDTRRDGFATSNQEHQRGILAVAVPVFSSTGVAGAVNLVGGA